MRFRRQTNPAERADPNVLLPPEGVPLRLDVAGIGARFGAQITDILLTGIGAVAVVVLLAALNQCCFS